MRPKQNDLAVEKLKCSEERRRIWVKANPLNSKMLGKTVAKGIRI